MSVRRRQTKLHIGARIVDMLKDANEPLGVMSIIRNVAHYGRVPHEKIKRKVIRALAQGVRHGYIAMEENAYSLTNLKDGDYINYDDDASENSNEEETSRTGTDDEDEYDEWSEESTIKNDRLLDRVGCVRRRRIPRRQPKRKGKVKKNPMKATIKRRKKIHRRSRKSSQ